MKKILLIVIGFLALFLGLIGIVLPVLPTTPFLILSATCFFNSSTKLYNWITTHKVFGPYINSYIKYKAMSIKSKIISISAMCFVMTITIIFFIKLTWLRVLLVFIELSVSFYIYTRKTLTKEMMESIS